MIRHKFIHTCAYALAIGALFVLAACSGSDKFTIKGQIEGAPSMNIYMKYYGNTALLSAVTVVNSGNFEFTGHSEQPTMVEIMDNEGKVMGRLYMANGDKANVRLDRRNPFLMEVTEGSQANIDFAEFGRKNADVLMGKDYAKANDLIEEFIQSNPKSAATGMLMASAYRTGLDPVKADSLMRIVAENTGMGSMLDGYLATVSDFAYDEVRIDSLPYRPREMDTTYFFTPAGKNPTLIAFTTERSHRKDSILPHLRQIKKDGKGRVLDFMLCRDTVTWRSSVRWDTATWQQAWAPGGIYAKGVEKLALPTLPFYIVVDTAGMQIYRGTSIAAAVDTLQAHSK